MFAVVVTFTLKSGEAERFGKLMRANARTSLAKEPGCTRFDVATDPERPNEVFLYELYTNAAAFDAHLGSAHFREFDAASAGMVSAKSVATYSEVQT